MSKNSKSNTAVEQLPLHSEYARGWRGRGSLQAMVKELERQKNSKFDFVQNSKDLYLKPIPVVDAKGNTSTRLHLFSDDENIMSMLGEDGIPMCLKALKQLGARVSPSMPGKYVGALYAERPERAAEHISDLMHDTKAPVLIRTMDNYVRAVLSDSYRIIDHYDIAFTALDVARRGGGEVVECSLTDNNMRIKMTSRSIFDAIDVARSKDGNWYVGGLGNQSYLRQVSARTTGGLPGGPGTVHPLVTLSNSETGDGGYYVRLGIVAAICFNIATVEEVVRQIHLGSRLECGIFSPETIAQENQTIFMKARDAVEAAFNQEKFSQIIERAKKANRNVIDDPVKAVDALRAESGMTEDQRDQILQYFLMDYNQTEYGLSQAVSRYAQDLEHPDKAESFEMLAGSMIR